MLVVYSDYACPFAYVGHRRVRRAQAEGLLGDVTWRPFELHPEVPREGVPRPRPGSGSSGAGGVSALRQLLEEDRLRVRPSAVVWNSRLSLLVAEHARDAGVHDRVHDRLFAAAWDEGLDLGRPEVLAEVLDAEGLDGAALVDAARRWTRVDRLTDALEEAWGRGVSGTPSYVCADGTVLRGVQPFDALVACG